MTEQTAILPGFNAASLNGPADRLPVLKIEENKQVLVNFLKDVPGMPTPPFVYAKVHWNSEMGENGRMFQCFGGACCEQVTWQRGFGGTPGKFEANKAKTRYYIPVVHYEQDPANPAVTKATIKYFDMTYTAYAALCTTIANTNEGLEFYDRDVIVSATKINGATSYIFDKRESQAAWKSNAIFTQQVQEQLPAVAQKLLNSMPQVLSEAEFMQMKPELDAKLNAAMSSRQAQQAQVAQAQPQQTTGFNQLPLGVPGTMPQAQPMGVPGTMPQAQQFTQPQANIPVSASAAQPVQAQPVVGASGVAPEQTVVEQEPKPFEVPQVDLSFDPNTLL